MPVTTKKTTPKPAAAKPSAPSYSITTKLDGFRRAGRAWTGTTKIGPDELTTEQLDQLRNDKTFIVVEL